MRTVTKPHSQIDKVSIFLALDTQSQYLLNKITHFFRTENKIIHLRREKAYLFEKFEIQIIFGCLFKGGFFF